MFALMTGEHNKKVFAKKLVKFKTINILVKESRLLKIRRLFSLKQFLTFSREIQTSVHPIFSIF